MGEDDSQSRDDGSPRASRRSAARFTRHGAAGSMTSLHFWGGRGGEELAFS